jgi:hypothetical protein
MFIFYLKKYYINYFIRAPQIEISRVLNYFKLIFKIKFNILKNKCYFSLNYLTKTLYSAIYLKSI